MKKHYIETKRLIMRDLEEKDADAWLEIFNSDKVGEFLRKRDDIELIKRGIVKKIEKYSATNGSTFSCILKENNKVIGNLDVKYNSDSKEAELGYVFNDKFWNNGYATECLFAAIDYAFSSLNAKKIVADCNDRNKVSNHILKDKLGMNLIDVKTNYIEDHFTGTMATWNFYELKKEDYNKRNK